MEISGIGFEPQKHAKTLETSDDVLIILFIWKMKHTTANETALPTILSAIPENPGVYMYFDENDTIIYVGKAKNLKKRVSSYFNKTIEDPKTRIMVRKIRNIR
jgi:hypothetical protein